MKTASISHAKNHLSSLLDQVRQGHSILILDRNQPVARLEPVHKGTKVDEDARLLRLERAGLICRGRQKLRPEFFTEPLLKTKDGSSVLDALLDERREGR